MILLKKVVLIHDLKRQGLCVSAIARQLGCDRKTVRKYLESSVEPPLYGPRSSRGSKLDGYEGGYTTVKKFLREVRPPARTQFERRFETPAGKQAQVDFAEFTDDPDVTRKGLSLLDGIGAFPLALGPVCIQPEPGDGDALSHCGLR